MRCFFGLYPGFNDAIDHLQPFSIKGPVDRVAAVGSNGSKKTAPLEDRHRAM